MLCDAYAQDYDMAVVISNDSDLVMPIEVVINQLGLLVGVFNPGEYPSADLQKAASFYRPIRAGALKASQFPSILSDAQGTILKPTDW